VTPLNMSIFILFTRGPIYLEHLGVFKCTVYSRIKAHGPNIEDGLSVRI